MIIGNGLLANTFSKYKDDNKVIIFASGVSNSKETSQDAFNREIELLNSISNKDVILVYFSTCSVYDFYACGSAYVKHKLAMEELIKNSFEKYIIFRLPIVIGKTNNPNTLFNYFKNKISNGETLKIFQGVTRYIIGVDELLETLSPIIDAYKVEGIIGFNTIDVAFDNKLEVLHLATMMMQIMGKTAPIEFDNSLTYSGKNAYNKIFQHHLDTIEYVVPKNYTYELLKKYL